MKIEKWKRVLQMPKHLKIAIRLIFNSSVSFRDQKIVGSNLGKQTKENKLKRSTFKSIE